MLRRPARERRFLVPVLGGAMLAVVVMRLVSRARTTCQQTPAPLTLSTPATTPVPITAEPTVIRAERQKSARSAWLVLALLVMATIASAFLGLKQYQQFRESLSLPTPPKQTAKFAVFFDEPDSDIRVIFYAEPSGYYSISAIEEDGNADNADAFLAVYTGSAGELKALRGVEEPLRIQAVRSPDGAEIAVLVPRDDGVLGLHRSREYADMSTFYFEGLDIEANVTGAAVGTVAQRGSASSANSYVYGRLPSVVSDSRGRQAGALPAIEAPREIREVCACWRGYMSQPIGSVIVNGRHWYPPTRVVVETIVDYSDPTPPGVTTSIIDPEHSTFPLPERYQLSRSQPSTEDDSQLRWVRPGGSRVTWLLEDLEAQNRSNASLFLAGILFGACFGFLASVLERIGGFLPAGRRTGR
jgi:hypothetical protein